MPEVRLRAMRAEEFAAWRTGAIRIYADDMTRNESLTDDAALAMATREFDELLPAGVDTPGQRIFLAYDGDAGGPLGWLWYGDRRSQPSPGVAWLYDIVVHEEQRGRGVGRRMMELLEAQVRADGRHRIELNVFADNVAARTLYEAIGYREMARQLAKELD